MSQFKVRFGSLGRDAAGRSWRSISRGIRPVSLAIFTAGFAASALEVVLLLASKSFAATSTVKSA